MARVVKKKASFGTSMGVSSVIAILVTLVLVVFSALSITTSKADLRLSQKTAAGAKAYYDADARAEDRMAEVFAIIAEGGDFRAGLVSAGYDVSSEDGGTVVAYTVSIDENRNLDVQLFVNGSDGKLTRNLWQVVPAKDWVADDHVDLFMPGP